MGNAGTSSGSGPKGSIFCRSNNDCDGISAVHQIEVPRPHTGLYRNWSLDPFGAAWHLWNPHNRSWEVMPRLRKPVPDANVYVCGEAFSSNQGWAEGALNTAERMLEDHFGLKRPTWISPTYNLGP